MTEQEYRDAVYAKAAEVRTPEDFAALIHEMEQDEFDYGRIAYACCAAAFAGFNVMNRTKNGGITGFQAGCMMWEMVHKFGMFSDGPLRIQDFDNLRYPQYDHKWTVRISQEDANTLMERAKEMVGKSPEFTADRVLQRNRDIAAGRFPDFVTIGESE